jgi:hypothetical protein
MISSPKRRLVLDIVENLGFLVRFKGGVISLECPWSLCSMSGSADISRNGSKTSMWASMATVFKISKKWKSCSPDDVSFSPKVKFHAKIGYLHLVTECKTVILFN